MLCCCCCYCCYFLYGLFFLLLVCFFYFASSSSSASVVVFSWLASLDKFHCFAIGYNFTITIFVFCSFLVCLPCWHTAAASSSSTCLNSKQLSSNLKLMWLSLSYSHGFPLPNELSVEQQQSTVTISTLLLLLFIHHTHALIYYSTPQLSADVSWWSKYSASSSCPSIWYEHMQACRAALCVSVFIAALSNNNHTHTHTHTLYYSKQKEQENCITYYIYIKELLNIFCLHFVVIVVVCCYSRRLA